MDDYIKRQEAIEAVKHAWAKGLEPTQYIEIIPAAWVREYTLGTWIKSPFGVCCSNCRVEGSPDWVCCPVCGAWMVKGEADG